MIKLKRIIVMFAFIGGIVVGSLVTIAEYSYNCSVVTNKDKLNDELNENDVILIDLRDEQDYINGHISNAINIPYTDDGKLLLKYLRNSSGKNKDIYLMCYSGNRAGQAFNLLVDKGIKNVNYISFGYEEYVNSMGDKFIPQTGECPCKSQ